MLTKRFLRFALKRSFGWFLKNELSLDQLEVEIGRGIVQLKNLEINVEAVNDLLTETNWVLKSGVVNEAIVSIPWTNLFAENCEIELKNLEIVATKQKKVEKDTHPMKESFFGSNSKLAESWAEFSQELQTSQLMQQSEIREESPELSEYNNEAEGPEVIFRLIEKILYRVKAKINHATITVLHYSQSLQQEISFQFHIPFLDFSDSTPPKEGEMDVLIRTIKFRGISLFLSETSDSEESFILEENLITVLRLDDTENSVVVQLRQQDRNSTSVPKLSAKLLLNSLQVTVAPKHFILLLELFSPDSVNIQPPTQSQSNQQQTPNRSRQMPVETAKCQKQKEQTNQSPEQGANDGFESCSDDKSDEDSEKYFDADEIDEEAMGILDDVNFSDTAPPASNIQDNASLVCDSTFISKHNQYQFKIRILHFTVTLLYETEQIPIGLNSSYPSDHLTLEVSNLVLKFQKSSLRTTIELNLDSSNLYEYVHKEELKDGGIPSYLSGNTLKESTRLDSSSDHSGFYRTHIVNFRNFTECYSPSFSPSNMSHHPPKVHPQLTAKIDLVAKTAEGPQDQEIVVKFQELKVAVDLLLVKRLENLSKALQKPFEKEQVPQKKEGVSPSDGPWVTEWWKPKQKFADNLEILNLLDADQDQNEETTTKKDITVEGSSLCLILRFPERRPHHLRHQRTLGGLLRDEVLLVEVFKPQVKSCLFSDAMNVTKVLVEFERMTITLENGDLCSRPFFEAQWRNTRTLFAATPLEITIRNSIDIPTHSPGPFSNSSSSSIQMIISQAYNDYPPSSPTMLPAFSPNRSTASPFSSFVYAFEGRKRHPTSAEDEDINFRHQAIESSKFVVSLLFPWSSLDIDKPNWELLNELIDSLTPESENNNGTVQPVFNSGESLLSIMVFFTDGEWMFREQSFTMPCNNNSPVNSKNDVHIFQFKFHELRYFQVMQFQGKPVNYTCIYNDFFELYDQIPTLQRSGPDKPVLYKLDTSESSKSTNVFSATLERTGNEQSIASLALKGLICEIAPDSISWLSRLVDFFSTSSQVAVPPILKRDVFLDLSDITIKLMSKESSANALVSLGFTEASIGIVYGSPELPIKLHCKDYALLLAPSELAHFPYKKNTSLKVFWESIGYCTVASLDFLEIGITIRKDEKLPKLRVEFTNHSLEMNFRQDSLKELIFLVKAFTNKSNDQTEVEQSEENPNIDNLPSASGEFTHLQDIDYEAFTSNRPYQDNTLVQSSAFNNYSLPSDQFGTPIYFTDPDQNYDPLKELQEELAVDRNPIVRWLGIERTISDCVIDDYVAEPTREENGGDFLRLPNQYPSPETEIVLRDVNILIRFFSSVEWDTSSSQEVKQATQDEKGFQGLPYSTSQTSGDFLRSSATTKSQQRNGNAFMEVNFVKVNLLFSKFPLDCIYCTRLALGIRDVNVVDNLPTSTWKKFMCYDGDITREVDSYMLSIQYEIVRPDISNLPKRQEARLKIAILPLRFNVDQDAVEFLIKFFSQAMSSPTEKTDSSDTQQSQEIYFQTCEIRSVYLKVDYKPKRVDYGGLTGGNFVELVNLFPLEGAVIRLNRVKLSGISGVKALLDSTIVSWFPHVAWNQVSGVVSGVQAIRPLVNLGSSVADLVLLPIEQYRRDGRLLTGLQRGASSFLRTLATESFTVGSRVAAGTQVLLESAEGVFSGSSSPSVDRSGSTVRTSKYADQPSDAREGIQFAYESISRELKNAMHTIVAIPIEEFQRSGTTGAVKSVIRAVPIAILRPVIGVVEGTSKALMGANNQIQPSIRQSMQDKYKQRPR